MSYDTLLSYEKELRHFLIRRLGCAALADDIYQNLVEKILRRSPQSLDNPKAYLFQSASNAVADHFRAQASRENYLYQARFDEDLQIDTKSPEQAIAATQAVEIVERAIAELPVLTQKIFYLYRLDGCTQQMIAAQLGISRSTVERRLAKAITHWQKRLAQVSAEKYR